MKKKESILLEYYYTALLGCIWSFLPVVLWKKGLIAATCYTMRWRWPVRSKTNKHVYEHDFRIQILVGKKKKTVKT